jgi:RHS repeat-associated protein
MARAHSKFLLASTGTTKPILGYDGELTDWDTGLVYLQARVYDPSISQFLTRDPLDAETGQAYEYAGDNPVNFEDPTGLQCSAAGQAWANGNAALLKLCDEPSSSGSFLSHYWRPIVGLTADTVTGIGCVASAGIGCGFFCSWEYTFTSWFGRNCSKRIFIR